MASSAARKRKQVGKRTALGKGLGALMSSTAQPVNEDEHEEEVFEETPSEATEEVAAPLEKDAELSPSGDGLTYVLLSALYPNRAQPRKFFDEEEIARLAESITQSGLLQPILVREKLGEGEERFEIVAGERRFRAAKHAGLESVPVLVRPLNDRETLEIGIVENVQREDLNPIEEALAYRRLVEEFEASHNEIAQTVGKDRASIANSLRLLKLEPGIQELIVEGRISAGHGRALLALSSFEQRRILVEKILHEGLSVRAAEAFVSGDKDSDATSRSTTKTKSSDKSPQVRELEERIRRALGTKVSLNMQTAEKGELRVSFFSPEELESILEKIGA